MENANAPIILQVRSDGLIYMQPGMTVGQMLALLDTLREVILNLPVNTAAQTEPAKA
jgi:ABC-type iron transport system FetAB permease component